MENRHAFRIPDIQGCRLSHVLKMTEVYRYDQLPDHHCHAETTRLFREMVHVAHSRSVDLPASIPTVHCFLYDGRGSITACVARESRPRGVPNRRLQQVTGCLSMI